ncbi:hypothetical protein LTS18_008514, partial [Coniosporium uncinatum]
THEDFLSLVEPAQVEDGAVLETQTIALLLTPSFAHWLSGDQTFLKKILERLLEQTVVREDAEYTVEVVLAVVDRLPAPSSVWSDLRALSAQERLRRPPLNEHGHEGLAYMLSNANTFSYTKANPGEKSPTSAATQSMNVEVIPRPLSDRLLRFPSYVFEVPLANTVFQNGRAATLFSSHWKKFSGTTELRHIQSWPLRNLTVPANCFVTEEGRVRPGQGRNHTYSIPLVALTAPKKIAAGMGNIIRLLEGVGGRDTTIPASSELESAVSAFLS